MMRVGAVAWPDRLEPGDRAWKRIASSLASAGPDLLITNEMPFGPWIAAASRYSRGDAQHSVDLHAAALTSLSDLPVDTVISSRPMWDGDRLVNEAFALSGGRYVPLHRKRYLPEEDGWHEATWFAKGSGPSHVASVAGVKTGVLLCTDAMFNEHARHYGRQGAELIAIPRATDNSTILWQTAGRMAALVSGAFVVSSNRMSLASANPCFGGQGFIIAPDGQLIAATSRRNLMVFADIDLAVCDVQKRQYPCYLPET